MKYSGQRSWRSLLVILVILLFAYQLFYLQADPSPDISTSRGPFSDEGLNTCQARNFVNHGSWGMQDCDNLIKSPLYNALLALEFWLFGSHRIVARSSILILFLLGLLRLSWRRPPMGIVLIITAALQYHLFQFQHFALVEPLVSICLLGAVISGARYLYEPLPNQHLNWCILWSFVAFFLKIQYFYALLIPAIFWLLATPYRPSTHRDPRQRRSLLLFLALGLLFVIAWYLPNRNFFMLLQEHQGSGRFAPLSIWFRAFKSSGETLLWNHRNLGFALSFSLSLLSSLLLWPRASRKQRAMLIAAYVWLALELHKSLILFTPSRYFISTFMAMGFLMAVVGSSLLQSKKKSHPLRAARQWLLPLLLLPLLIQHLGNHRSLWQNRSFRGQALIKSFEPLEIGGKTVAGVWATALVWNPAARVIPVWADFLNADLHPGDPSVAMIFCEAGEADSGAAFKGRGIDLQHWCLARDSAQYGPYQLHWYYLPASTYR